MIAAMTQRIMERMSKMPYKIDLIQVRKLTVYCNAENEEGAENADN